MYILSQEGIDRYFDTVDSFWKASRKKRRFSLLSWYSYYKLNNRNKMRILEIGYYAGFLDAFTQQQEIIDQLRKEINK